MRLTFKTISIHNFLCFKDEEFDFSENRKMTLVCGKNNDVKDSKNGSGKTSICSSLLYALFGELQNKIKNENLRNRYTGQKDMSVDLDFMVGDVAYHVRRGLNKHGQSYVSLFRKDGEEYSDITRSSILETNSYLENEILQCDISIFLRTVFLSSDQNYNFFRLKPQPKKDFIERLFNISIFGEMYGLIHKDILQNDKLIYAKQNRLLLLNNTETDYLNRMEAFKNENEKNLKTLESRLEVVQQEYENLKKIHVKNNSEEVRKYEEAINKLNDGVIKIKDLLKDIQKKLSKLTKTKFKLESSKDEKKKILDKYSELLGKLCEKCLPIVSDYYDLTKYATEIEELNTKSIELDKEMSELNSENDMYSEKLEKIVKKTSEIQKKIEELTSESNTLKMRLVQYESQMSVISRDLEKEKNAVNPYKELFEKNHEEIQMESKELEEISEKYKYLKYAETIVSQDTLKKFIIKDLVHLLNVKIKYYLSRLGSNYTCVFDENMDYEFLTEGGTCEYDNFSSGERMRLMIAASFAFKDFMSTRSNITSNILILDEFIDSNIDTVAIENIMKILQEFSAIYNQSVYVISHRKEIDNSIFDNIIQVVKTDNISKITYLPSEKF